MERQNDRNTKRDFRNSIRGYSHYVYLMAKSRWAGWMERKTARLSVAGVYVLFGTLLFSFGSYCIFLIFHGFWGNNSLSPKLEPMRQVKTAGYRAGPAPSDLNQQDYYEITRFEMQIDSLCRYNPVQYDSIRRARPGLLDSIRMVSNYYESNYKNKKNGK
ncbi:hypothetical protein NU09_0921 [Flavobacterium beibuense]|uniref:Uncharacterized protein n=2 Tax=Flavobacterium beibuense TaxID=657326 RepID=A0A444WEM8_9FLAO|nr:hypothetical protein NU09_0921 [Flavobacterium beibuense]